MASSATASPFQPLCRLCSAWTRAVVPRFRVYFWAKQWGTCAAMTAFFICYFVILNHPVFPVTTMPLTAVDRWIGFQPAAAVFYISLWIYVPLLPALLVDKRELARCVVGSVVLSAIGLAIFVLWPTIVPHPRIDWSRYPVIIFLKSVDASGNACPSLHVAFAVFTALGFSRLFRQLRGGPLIRLANLAWSSAIVYSTLATKQHVAIDAVAGALLGALVAGFCFSPRPLVATTVVMKLTAVFFWLANLPVPLVCGLFFSLDGLILYNLFVPNSQWLCRVFTRFATERPEVWLTIDDGPDPEDTPRILDLLDRHQARASFFLVGENASRHPALVDEIRRRGHEVGHHTHTHPLAGFWCASPRRVRRELDDALAVLERPDARPRLFRAPAGIKNLFLAGALAARGLSCVGWSVRSRDSIARRPDHIVARVMKRVRPGAIVLMHEGARLHPGVRVEAIARLLAAFHARGLRCVIPAEEQLRR